MRLFRGAQYTTYLQCTGAVLKCIDGDGFTLHFDIDLGISTTFTVH